MTCLEMHQVINNLARTIVYFFHISIIPAVWDNHTTPHLLPHHTSVTQCPHLQNLRPKSRKQCMDLLLQEFEARTSSRKLVVIYHVIKNYC